LEKVAWFGAAVTTEIQEGEASIYVVLSIVKAGQQ
jgi:hypothetical protein